MADDKARNRPKLVAKVFFITAGPGTLCLSSNYCIQGWKDSKSNTAHAHPASRPHPAPAPLLPAFRSWLAMVVVTVDCIISINSPLHLVQWHKLTCFYMFFFLRVFTCFWCVITCFCMYLTCIHVFLCVFDIYSCVFMCFWHLLTCIHLFWRVI